MILMIYDLLLVIYAKEVVDGGGERKKMHSTAGKKKLRVLTPDCWIDVFF